MHYKVQVYSPKHKRLCAYKHNIRSVGSLHTSTNLIHEPYTFLPITNFSCCSSSSIMSNVYTYSIALQPHGHNRKNAPSIICNSFIIFFISNEFNPPCIPHVVCKMHKVTHPWGMIVYNNSLSPPFSVFYLMHAVTVAVGISGTAQLESK